MSPQWRRLLCNPLLLDGNCDLLLVSSVWHRQMSLRISLYFIKLHLSRRNGSFSFWPWRSELSCCQRATWEGAMNVPWKLRVAPRWQPARKQGHQSYNWENWILPITLARGRGIWATERKTAQLMPWVQACKTLSIGPTWAMPRGLALRNWEVIHVCCFWLLRW